MTVFTMTFDPADVDSILPVLNALLERPIDSPSALKQWLADLCEVDVALDECYSRRYIAHTCHTDDAELEKAYLHMVQVVMPALKPVFFELQKKFLACPHRDAISDPKLTQLARLWQAEVDLYREPNIALQVRETELSTQYGKLCGEMLVDFDGRTLTLQQLARYLEETDRDVRQRAWELSTNRRLQDREAIDEIYDKLVSLRADIATNADEADFRAYAWKMKKRFDYTPADCTAFADAVAEVCVPLVSELAQQRREALGVESLRPWDQAVDPLGRAPLRPFAEDAIDDFVARTHEAFTRISPMLAERFSRLKMGEHLDLDSRKGKRPGGYQSSLEQSKQPFIFMNAVGVHRDVETLLHEGGHAFHYQAACEEPISFLRHAPLEFCEVASMSMELLGDDHMNVFYESADADRAKRVHLEGVITILPWIATIDSVQRLIYPHPKHSRAERTAQWLTLLDRFMPHVDYSGYNAAREALWQKQLHLFGLPFYYIEYGIAQLGALQVWQNYRDDPKQALADLERAFALGGTRPLPELFEAAGIRFDFTARTMRPLIDAVREELAALPV